MFKDILEHRSNCAKRYYAELSLVHFDSLVEWKELLQKFVANQVYGVPELLVLIHPKWYEKEKLIKIEDPRGPRQFPAAKSEIRCRGIEIYGYDCPFVNPTIQIDHQFPYSKGGVTIYSNAMYLCAEHNLSKSIDIHLMDWDNFSTDWVSLVLQKFVHEVSRQTNSPPLKFSKILDRK